MHRSLVELVNYRNSLSRQDSVYCTVCVNLATVFQRYRTYLHSIVHVRIAQDNSLDLVRSFRY